MIKINNLSKKYGDTAIFNNASFSFPEKGLICVLGPSGCGKSTLLNLIAGFDGDYDGEIIVHGTKLSSLSPDEMCAYRKDNVGFIFQNYHLIGGYGVLENILLASDAAGTSRSESKPKALKLLEKLGLADKAYNKTEILSGGQKQRVAIARALINDPSVILADEPTGALDRKNSSEIMELLKTLAESRPVIVITHDKKCAEYASQVVTIQNGRLESNASDEDITETAVLKKSKSAKISMLKRAAKNFKIRLPRYAAISLAVSVGVLCFMLSLSSGNIIGKSIKDFEAKNTAYHNGYIRTDGNEEEVLDILNKDEHIENVYLQYKLADVSVKIGDVTIEMAEKYPMAKTEEQMSYGIMPRNGKNEIALAPSMAAKFDKDIGSLIGKNAELSYNGKTYYVTVSGIFNASYDDYFVSSDIEKMMYDGAEGTAYSASYDVIRFEDIVSVNESLKEQGILSKNASDEVAAFLNTFKNIEKLFMTVSVLILIIGLFISAVLLVKQQNTRYHEMGLLSALGYKRQNVGAMILYENIMLSIASMLSLIVLIVLTSAVSAALSIGLTLTFSQTLLAVIITAVIILAVGFISSFKLINTEPAAALRK